MSDLLVMKTVVDSISTRLLQSVDRSRVKGLTTKRLLFMAAFEGLEVRRGPRDMEYVPAAIYNCSNCWGKSESGKRIIAYGPKVNWGYKDGQNEPKSLRGVGLMLHEFGHIIDQRTRWDSTSHVYNGSAHTKTLIKEFDKQKDIAKLIQNIWDVEGDPLDDEVDRPNKMGTASGLGVNWRTSTYHDEIWADLFASWALNSYNFEAGGGTWKKFMDDYMRDIATNFARYR